MVGEVVQRTFEDAKQCIESSAKITPDQVFYWRAYLSALETVALRGKARELAVEIIEFREGLDYRK
jgi:hypothetical protein